jgi:cytochrome b subunit of formate dehydrogenase
MAKRVAMSAAGKGMRMNRHGILNVAVDAAVALGFLLAAVSGIYFMFADTGRAADPGFIFSRTTWDLVHTWSAVVMIVAAVIHFAIHWRWVTKVTARVLSGLKPSPKPPGETAAERTGA